jgi:hypothetical protein
MGNSAQFAKRFRILVQPLNTALQRRRLPQQEPPTSGKLLPPLSRLRLSSGKPADEPTRLAAKLNRKRSLMA